FLAGKDTALADLPTGKDTILLADLPAGKDTPEADLPAGNDTRSADLPPTVADVRASDVAAGDAPPADRAPRDGPADGVWGCRSDAAWPAPCNDNPNSQAVMGTCQPDGTCACSSAYVINPSTGRCRYPPLPCTPGANQTCNDNPLVSSIWGTCQPDGTCACTAGHVVNPDTGRCMMAPVSDASTGGDASASCTGDYTACGCGCCGGVQATPRCYYPSLGETIAAITAQDLATRSASNCAFVGCGLGIHYLCCPEAAPEAPSGATYAADGYSGGLDHVTISKSGPDCATVSFARPMTSTGSWLKIATPSSWGVVSGGFGTCGDAGVMGQAQGAVGTLGLRASGSQCLADLHATLFAFAADGTVKTARLDVDGVAVTGLPGGLCN
ncbi:MAG TPA: hypothetical protein VF518_08325, partial [Polyangia bacterium]